MPTNTIKTHSMEHVQAGVQITCQNVVHRKLYGGGSEKNPELLISNITLILLFQSTFQ
jgi:hypothetical protein